MRISLLPPLWAQNTDAGFASAHARCGPMTSMATKINAIDRRILFFLRFALSSIFYHTEPKRQTKARCAVETDGMVKDEAAITDAASPSQRDVAKAYQSRQMRSFLSTASSSGDLTPRLSSFLGGTSLAVGCRGPIGASLTFVGCPV